MTHGGTACLIANSTVASIIVIFLSVLYHYYGTCPQINCDGGEETQEVSTHIDFLNCDSSTQQQTTKEDCHCKAYQLLGFEIFELIILTLVGIGIWYGFIRLSGEGKNWIKKWKENKASREEKKYREYCAKFESTTSKVHHVGPKGRTRTKTRNLFEPNQPDNKITYEKGDSAGSEEEEVVWIIHACYMYKNVCIQLEQLARQVATAHATHRGSGNPVNRNSTLKIAQMLMLLINVFRK